jgi:hypothetical protein
MKRVIIALIFMVVPCTVFAQISWMRQNIDVDFGGARSVYAADIDGDTHMDVVGAAFNADDIAWWENDGDENFTKHTIADNFDGATSVFAIDLDGDTDVDVLGAAFNADDITWWENDGSDPPSFTEHTIKGNFDGARSVFATDINGDGDIDVVGTAQTAGDILWWESDGNQPPSFTEHVINNNLANAYNVYAANLDNDNDTDIVVAVYSSMGVDNITWWENTDGSGTNWTKHLIINDYFQATSVYAIDLDIDNDNDILAVAGSGRPILWWRNDGSGNFAPDTISSAIGNRTDVCALDVDDDTDVDIVSTGAYTVDWFENDGDENFTRHLIAQALSQVKSTFAIDLDSDTDIDVLVAIENADDIAWWKNSLITEHNVGPLTIDVPDTVPYDTTVQPRVTVKNFGLNTETFNMTCEIDPGDYQSSTVAHLVPDESRQVTFPVPFTFDEGGSYTVTVYTELDSDENPANDTLEKIIEVPIVLDVGPISIDIPDSVPVDTTFNPQATAKNMGTATIASFTLTCDIDYDDYHSTRTITDLAPGAETQVTFFTPILFDEPGIYEVAIYSRLADDADPSNDTLRKTIVVYVLGVAEGYTQIPDVFEFMTPTISRKHTEIKLALPVATTVDLVVYDALGRLSQNLISERFSAGTYSIPTKLDLPAGVYFYKLKTTSGENVIKKFLIVE